MEQRRLNPSCSRSTDRIRRVTSLCMLQSKVKTESCYVAEELRQWKEVMISKTPPTMNHASSDEITSSINDQRVKKNSFRLAELVYSISLDYVANDTHALQALGQDIELRLEKPIDKTIFGLYNVMQREKILIFKKENPG